MQASRSHSEAIMIYDHGREPRKPDVSAPKEIVGTTLFTASLVGLILLVV